MKNISREKYTELKENIDHGDILFHMSVHIAKIKRNEKIILYCHWHDEIEILVITKGRAKVQIGSNSYKLEEGEYVFIQPNELHGAYTIDGNEVEFYAVVIHGDFLASFINDLIQQKFINTIYEGNAGLPVCFSRKEEENIKILPVLDEMKEAYFEREFGYELLVKAKVFETFYRLYKYTGDNLVDAKVEDDTTVRVKVIIQYIKENFQKKIELKELAEIIHMSEGHFCKFFKDNVSMKPMEYLNGYRISEASKLLRTTNKKILEIAMSVGFNSESYFIIVFKKILRCTPTEYRKTNSK